MNIRTKEVNSLLVIQLAGLGDMIMATSAIEALRRLYPQAKICLLTNPRSVDIIRGSSYINEIFVLEGLRNIFIIIKRLRDYHFDMLINLCRLYSFKGAIKMFLLFWAIGGKYWVGRDTAGRGFFYHLKVPEKLSDKKHEVEYKVDIIGALGGEVKDINLKVEYDEGDENFVNAFLNREGITKDDILVGINCSTFRPSRNWGLESYAKLADYIVKRLRVKIIFLGIAKDKNLLLKIKKMMKQKPLDFVGAFSVRQLTIFLKRCRLLISPDSGMIHIASALEVPMVVLFGPGEYERYKPWGNEEKTIIIRKEVECSPCFKKICHNKKCMKLITPEEVFGAVEHLLGE
jgi:ADP-heptose:LPS heptosyltransferase